MVDSGSMDRCWNRATGLFLAAVATLLSALSMGSCRQAENYVGVEVQRGTTDERIDFAKKFASDSRRDWLLRRVKERFPLATDAELSRLYVTWRGTVFTSLRGQGQRTRVYVVVGLRDGSGSSDGELLSYCASEVADAMQTTLDGRSDLFRQPS